MFCVELLQLGHGNVEIAYGAKQTRRPAIGVSASLDGVEAALGNLGEPVFALLWRQAAQRTQGPLDALPA